MDEGRMLSFVRSRPFGTRMRTHTQDACVAFGSHHKDPTQSMWGRGDLVYTFKTSFTYVEHTSTFSHTHPCAQHLRAGRPTDVPARSAARRTRATTPWHAIRARSWTSQTQVRLERGAIRAARTAKRSATFVGTASASSPGSIAPWATPSRSWWRQWGRARIKQHVPRYILQHTHPSVNTYLHIHMHTDMHRQTEKETTKETEKEKETETETETKTETETDTETYWYTCTCTKLYTRTHIHTHTKHPHTHAHTHAYIYIYIPRLMHKNIHTRAHTHTHIRTCARTRTPSYIHTHTRSVRTSGLFSVFGPVPGFL